MPDQLPGTLHAETVLEALLAARRPQFALLAEAWVANGATMFEVRQAGQTIARWPHSNADQQIDLAALIEHDDHIIGELRVAGVNTPAAKAQLMAAAGFVAGMAHLEEELQTMTAELVDSRDQLLALYALIQSVRGQVSLEETLRCLVVEAARLTSTLVGFAAFVPMADRPILVQNPSHIVDEGLLWRCFWQAQSSGTERLIASGATESLPRGIENLLFIPLHVRGAVVAGLGLLNKTGGGFTGRDLRLARVIADQISAQIENILLHQEASEQSLVQHELELARRVQADLLPQHTPNIPGLDVFAHSRPALQVGGDFYDFIVRPMETLIFAVGDVSGKGLPAALLMTMVRTAIHSKASFMPAPTPEAVMRNANEDLYDHFAQVGMFATVFIGEYEPATRILRYASAGHSPVIFRPANGAPQLLNADDTAIGVMATSHWGNQSIMLGPGDLLFVGTDGFSDVRNAAGELFGLDRLIQIVNTFTNETARALADALYEAVDRFDAGGVQDDDQTIVVLKGV